MKRAAGFLVAVLAMLVPLAAAACPQCAGRNDGGITRTLVLGAFVLFPFVVVAAVIRVIRAGERDADKPRATQPPVMKLQNRAPERS